MLSVIHAYSGALTILNSVHDSIYSIVGKHIVYTSQCTYTLIHYALCVMTVYLVYAYALPLYV